ncbi:MAG: hypothetical protein WCT99_09570 [Bacteroidota bacterium]|jgi:hypothetical protein
MKTIICSLILFTLTASAGEKNLSGNLLRDLSAMNVDSTLPVQSAAPFSGEQKNPFLNGLYSLVIPGAGQYNTDRYTKAVIFFTAEVALVTFAIINQHTGDKKTQEFQEYADAHWSAVRYAAYINAHGSVYYGPPNANIDLSRVANKDFSQINDWEKLTHSVNGSKSIGFSHQLPRYGEQQYYELIGKYNQFKTGWDTYPQDNQGVPISDDVTHNPEYDYDHMIPKQMQDYAKERGKANDYYYAASFAVSAIVINHVISAVDAFISTKSYNHEISASLGMRPVDSYDGTRLLSELTVSVGF